MRRGRILIFVVLILVVGLVVAVVALRALFQPPKPQAPVYVDIVIAGQNIPQGGKITEAVLGTIKIRQEDVTVGEFTVDKKAELLNNKVARFPLDQGTVITRAMVLDSAQAVPIGGPEWAALIPPGMTALSVPTSRLTLAAYGINDGAHVNVNACFLFVDVDPNYQSETPNNTSVLSGTGFPQGSLPILSITTNSPGASSVQGRLELDPALQQPFYVVPSEQQRPRVACQTIFQDVVVMKLGNFPLATTTTQAAQQQQQQQAAAPAPDIATLILSPQDAVTLTYLIYTNAKITMALRNAGDQSRMATEAATLQFLLSQYNIPVPAKLPYALQPRIDSLLQPVLPNDTPPAQ